MPSSAVLVVCSLLIGLSAAMTVQSVALAADGSFQLVRVLGSKDVYGFDSRILGETAHQEAVVLAARAGVTDTHLLSILLGVGQLLLPALAWSLAVILSRTDRLVCAAVAMIAGLCAGATWFFSVSELVLAVPLTILVAVLLWQPRTWRWRDIALAAAAASVLVASYETAVVTGSVLAVWAAWRATRAQTRAERYGCAIVGALSLLSVPVAVIGTQARTQTHSQSFLYFVVSLEPWPFYLALAGIAAVIASLGPWLDGTGRSFTLAAACAALVVALVGLEPNTVTAFHARGGAAVAGLMLVLFLWWQWIRGQYPTLSEGEPKDERVVQRILVVAPTVLVAAMVAVNVQPVLSWSRSLDTFRREVDRRRGVVHAVDVLPPSRRAVLWGWTSSSMSLLVRGRADAAILVDRNPSLVPFPIAGARNQLADAYLWDG
ncbi:MAG TPA: hypothetical protein VHI53_03800 [Gaiellaceae bacterium]|nr:hypothetical protein [Gaiellaceae bacterium]